MIDGPGERREFGLRLDLQEVPEPGGAHDDAWRAWHKQRTVSKQRETAAHVNMFTTKTMERSTIFNGKTHENYGKSDFSMEKHGKNSLFRLGHLYNSFLLQMTRR